MPGKNLIYALVTIGALVPTFFTSMGWVFLLHPRIGIINKYLIELFGLEQAPFNIASLVGMGWVEGLGLSSIAFIMIVATYRSMDPALEEAARVHGLGNLAHAALCNFAADLSRHHRRIDLYFHHRLVGLRSAGDHRHVEQNFYLLDFYLLQNPTAGRAAKLRHGRAR